MLTEYKAQFDFSAIERADLQPSTKDKYKRAVMRLVNSGISPFDSDALADYAASLPGSPRANLKSALALMAEDYKRMVKAGSTTDNAQHIQVMLWRLEAMDAAIVTHTPKGTKAHIWLNREQVENITTLPDDTLRGRRDYIVLAVLLGAGLRRDELVNLSFDSLKQQPSKTGFRYVLEVTGKGAKSRVIPISDKLAARLNDWSLITQAGHVARSVSSSDSLGESLSAIGIHNIVRKYGTGIGIPELDSHDLRRTFARLGYDAGVPVEQISKLLGHADTKTTMLYLGIEIDIEATVSDYIPLH